MDALAQLNVSLGGRYSIEREIGRGGMATVYRARDIKHNRHVALKVLNPELGAVLGVERFLSEIQVTANLQHPNLLPLFDSGDAEGLLYYVMPYIEGESLRAKLTREKQLPVDEAIRIASAVASALDYAHRHGVIHRDLKPENILLLEGQPLVADFGIALAVSVAAGDRITQTGVSLGTPQYMSPEQATGDRVIDGRTDVYSLGAVAYEMLTAEPPHIGTTAQAIIARVLTDQVRGIRLSRATVPEHVEAAVMRALEKLPADRWHTAHEFADALGGRAGPVGIPGGVRTPGALPRSRESWREKMFPRRTLVIAGAVVAAGLLVAVGIAGIAARTSGAPSVSFIIEPPMHNGVPQRIVHFALSPDGQTIALIAGSEVGTRAYLRRLSEPVTYPITATENAESSAFSPDGTWLGVLTYDGKLLKVRVDGAANAITLADGIFAYGGLAWIDNETILLGTARPNRLGLGRIAATGGPIRPVTQPKAPAAHGFPFVAADGKTVLFAEWGPGFVEDDFLAIGSVETGTFRASSLLVSRPFGVVDGWALYVSGASIMAVPFDAKRLTIAGDPVRVVEQVTADWHNRAALSLSGTLAYRRGQPTSRLMLLDRDGRMQELSSDGQSIFTSTDGEGSAPRFSPDGQRVAIDFWEPSGDTTAANIWTFDVKSRTFTRVTSLGSVIEPDWTPDGRRLLFTTWFRRNAALWMQVVDGSQPPEQLYQATEGVALFRATATPDGRGVVFCQGSRFSAATDAKLYYLPFLGERKPERLLDEPMNNFCHGRVSPDGRWLAYVVTASRSASSSTTDVYVRPFRRPGGRVRVSQGNGVWPTWSRDGRRLFYCTVTSPEGKFWAVAATVQAKGNSLEVLDRKRVAALPNSTFDVTPDGKSILAMQESYSGVQLVVTTNWLPQLRARVAGRQ